MTVGVFLLCVRVMSEMSEVCVLLVKCWRELAGVGGEKQVKTQMGSDG